MTKIILLFLVVSLPSFAQTDELTLESTTSPTIIEDGTDFSAAPAEEPVETSETVNVTENGETVDLAPEKTVPEEVPTEVGDSAPEEVTTPNPIAEDKKPDDRPEEVAAQDRVPSPSVSTPVITTEVPKDDRFINHRKSHWITTFGFEGLKYELPFEFSGVKKNFKDREQELYGARLGFGGQLYLGAGFFTTSKIDAFYNGTLFTKIQNAGPEDEDEEVAQLKRTGGVYGAEISQQFGIITEFRTKNPFMDEWSYLTFEPFIEAGLGVAQAYNSVTYYYDSAGVIDEGYRQRISDRLTNTKLGAGFNITGRSGFFMFARATVNRFDIIERKTRTFTKEDGQVPTTAKDTIKDAKMDPVTIFALGGGYKF